MSPTLPRVEGLAAIVTRAMPDLPAPSDRRVVPRGRTDHPRLIDLIAGRRARMANEANDPVPRELRVAKERTPPAAKALEHLDPVAAHVRNEPVPRRGRR